jgi:hypothetical protein
MQCKRKPMELLSLNEKRVLIIHSIIIARLLSVNFIFSSSSYFYVVGLNLLLFFIKGLR